MGDSDPVLLVIEGPVATLSFNRPERHNAANDAMDDAFFDILEQLHADPSVRAIVLRGEGPSFSSGRDTSELGLRRRGESDMEFIERGHRYTRLLLTMPAPIVVALKGWVIGGSFERALLCDIRVASEDAKMRLPEVAHGVIPDSAGVARLFQMAGHGLASDLVLTGRVLTADEALRHGVVSRVVPEGDLDATVRAIADTIAAAPHLAVRLARRTIANLGHPDVLRTLDDEWLAQSALMASDEYKAQRDTRLSGDA